MVLSCFSVFGPFNKSPPSNHIWSLTQTHLCSRLNHMNGLASCQLRPLSRLETWLAPVRLALDLVPLGNAQSLLFLASLNLPMCLTDARRALTCKLVYMKIQKENDEWKVVSFREKRSPELDTNWCDEVFLESLRPSLIGHPMKGHNLIVRLSHSKGPVSFWSIGHFWRIIKCVAICVWLMSIIAAMTNTFLVLSLPDEESHK